MARGKETEVVNLMPETYDFKEKNFDEKHLNYISLSFYEHDYSVQKYLKRKMNSLKVMPKIDTVIKFPLVTASQIFRIAFTVGADQGALDFAKNLAYEALTETTDPEAIENTLKESIEHPIEKIKEIYQKEGFGDAVTDIGIAKGISSTLDSKSNFFTGSKFASGVAYNPNTRVLFDLKREPIHRVFMFNFVLYPKNEEEIKNIRRAEYLLFHHSLPTRWKGGELLGQHENQYINHFKYPKKVQPNVFIGGKEFNKFRFMESVVTNVSLSPLSEDNDSDITFIQNEENQIFAKRFVLSLNIMESKMFTRNDVENKKGTISEEDILQY